MLGAPGVASSVTTFDDEAARAPAQKKPRRCCRASRCARNARRSARRFDGDARRGEASNSSASGFNRLGTTPIPTLRRKSQARRARRELDRDMEKPPGGWTTPRRGGLQSRMLEATFEMYFRVLKNAASDSPARGIRRLMTPQVGLAQQITAPHLRQLHGGSHGGVPASPRGRRARGGPESAGCLLTACEILSGHGEALQVHAGEFRPPTLRRARPAWRANRMGLAANAAAAARRGRGRRSRAPFACASCKIAARGHKQVDQGRVAAFAKRLAGAATRRGW